MEITLQLIRDGIVRYHEIYGWSPTIQELNTFLGTDNIMELYRMIAILRKYEMVICDGQRTLRTKEIFYKDERSEEFKEKMDLTLRKKEKQIYEFLVKYILEHRIAPSLKEIAAAIGINPVSSQRSVQRHLEHMSEKGAVVLGPKRSKRTIHVIGVNAVSEETIL